MNSVKDKLPENNTYVLVHYTGGNWRDRHDQAGCEWTVAKFVRGISLEERKAMPVCDRKKTYRTGDEWQNNHLPFAWDEHGPMTLFGQDVDYWAPIANTTKPSKD